MRVNSALRAIVKKRYAVFCGTTVIILSIFFVTSSITTRSKSDLIAKRVNLTVREIGHHLLLQAGNSSSRVMPVNETREGVFLLEFENELVFKPDTLVALTQRFLTKTGLPADYTVTVHECNKPGIVYGFEVSPENHNIIPCRGRIQPQGCYKIEIAFANLNTSSTHYSPAFLLVSSFLVLFGVGLLVAPFRRNPLKDQTLEQSTRGNNENLATIGKFTFDFQNQYLLLNNEKIVLTDKECKILELLNNNFGQLTPRENLIQIWTSEGVVTGRSLDMFVSKLRKKLSGDAELRITNVHGKGYKLEISNY